MGSIRKNIVPLIEFARPKRSGITEFDLTTISRYLCRDVLSKVSVVYEARIGGGLGQSPHVSASLPPWKTHRHAQFIIRVTLIAIAGGT